MPRKTTKTTKKKGVALCSGCINEFKYTELFRVEIVDKFEMSFQTYFCEKCVKSKNFPPHITVENLGLVKEPRKKTR